MKPSWIVEDFDDKAIFLVNEIKSQGYVCECLKYVPFQSGSYNQFKDEECVIIYGSLNLGIQLLKEKGWTPGVYWEQKNYLCHNYYPHFGKFLINYDFYMLPYKTLLDNKEKVFSDVLDYGGVIFVRPDNGHKTFTGQIITAKTWDRDINQLSLYGIEDNELVLISSPKNLDKEYRIIIRNSDPITGSLYKVNGRHKESPEVPQEVYAFVRKVLSEVAWRPDSMWVMDVCLSNNQLYILEIGCFSCSGLYACDLPTIVKEVSEQAMIDWKNCN